MAHRCRWVPSQNQQPKIQNEPPAPPEPRDLPPRVAPPFPAPPWRPTRDQLAAAVSKTVPDIIAPRPRVLFVGINPGLYSAAIGQHFGHPGNRFWPALYAGGFTDRILSPFEECLLPGYGLGLTNMCRRATATTAELSPAELRAGRRTLAAKIKRNRPAFVALLGLTSFRTAFNQPAAVLGRQAMTLHDAVLWVLPNPSGLNAHHTPSTLARLFRDLREAVARTPRA